MELNYLQIIGAIFIGLASGYLGSFMVLKRMALVGDALSHVALPGIALGLIFNFNPLLGAFATLFIGIIGIWLVENKTELPAESVVGLFFTFALAIGLLITPEPELLEALFGDISKISGLDTIIASALSVLVILIMRAISKGFILGTISKDLAKASGVKVGRGNFIFMLLIATIVALGIKSVGTLLMGALVIIPAIASRNIATSINGYIRISAIIGLISLVGGILLASALNLAPGPIVVLTSAVIFAITFVLKK